MNKYIKTFDTDADYQSFISGEFDKPNLSYVKATNEVHYNKKPDYSKEYLTVEALERGRFRFNVPFDVDSTYMTSVSYSIDDGANWVTTMIDNTDQTITTPTIAQGGKVLWKGVGKAMSASQFGGARFINQQRYNVSGNIMSMLYGDEFVNKTIFPSETLRTFFGLFYNQDTLISAENLILPAASSKYCYQEMFRNCTSLTTAPELPATTLADYCYNDMFNGCTSLATAPVLPATTLAVACYLRMFQDCTSLNSIKMLATDISASICLLNWVQNVAATGTFTKAASMTTLPTGASGIPENWTVVDA